jgi:hypothetical protein
MTSDPPACAWDLGQLSSDACSLKSSKKCRLLVFGHNPSKIRVFFQSKDESVGTIKAKNEEGSFLS